MYQYLTPAARLVQAPDMPAGWDAHVITGLDPSRVSCLVGTNAADYGAVSQAVGPRSDAEHVWAAWEVNIGQVTSVPDPIAPTALTPDTPGGLTFTISLPPAGKQLLGVHAALTLDVELLS